MLTPDILNKLRLSEARCIQVAQQLAKDKNWAAKHGRPGRDLNSMIVEMLAETKWYMSTHERPGFSARKIREYLNNPNKTYERRDWTPLEAIGGTMLITDAYGQESAMVLNATRYLLRRGVIAVITRKRTPEGLLLTRIQ